MRRGIPEDWSGDTSDGQNASDSQIPDPGNVGTHSGEHDLSGQVSHPSVNVGALSASVRLKSQHRMQSQRKLVAKTKVVGGRKLHTPQPVPPGRVTTALTTQRRIRLPRNWLLWAGLGGVISVGMGAVAIAMLLKLPAAPNCPSIFWPLASASVRLHCAQVAANKQSVNDLLSAIALVQALPENHPLRPEINRYLQQWSEDILSLANAEFQAGKLEEAIAVARQIPDNVPAYQAVESRIGNWQSIWSQAETVYAETEAQLRAQNWHQAFMSAVRLLNVGNEYWATTKYEELNLKIETTRADANNLAKAQTLAKTGGLTNLLAAIKLAESIGTESYIYQDARAAIPEFGQQMLDLAEATLDRRDADAAIDIANSLPASTGLQVQAQDFVALAMAWRNAWIGTIPGLEAAISSAQRIAADRPLYNQAQELITRWQLEIEAVTYLDKARELAQGGTVNDLTAAIAQAKLITDTNPRAAEAIEEINRWQSQVETIEDRPTLNRAEDLAMVEDVNSLQAAVNEASQIQSNRSLYREAQRKIRTWNAKIQRIQDQPILDEARFQATNGNLLGAIATAERIAPGRALSSAAQAAVDDWQGQIRARENWQEAQRIALQGTPDALQQAIRLARRVPRSSPLRQDVNPAIAQWSQQILNMALTRGEYDLPGGIEIAQKVPRGTDAYRAAQAQIAVWEKILNPPPPPAPSPTITPQLRIN